MFAAAACGGGSADSKGSSSGSSSSKSPSKSASPTPSGPRVEGTYDTGSGFIVTIKPVCKTGPCDVVLSYDYPRGSTGSGRLKFDGKAYDGDVSDKTGCLVGGVFGKPAAAGTVHYHFTVVGGGSPAKKITGTRQSSYHLVGKYKAAPGCLPPSSMTGFTGTLI
jgi:hypothetical protein